MSSDYQILKDKFKSINIKLHEISLKIQENLYEILNNIEHIDTITCRVKKEQSFLNKALKQENDTLKYKEPLQEIQDLIGARIVVYFKNDVDIVIELVKQYFQFVEETKIIPDDVKKFGYEGQHFICFIPNAIFSNHKDNKSIPDFFELQIKTLYQHAWSQAEHGLGYKPGSSLSYDETRKLAFIAAQSWGADTILLDLIYNKIE